MGCRPASVKFRFRMADPADRTKPGTLGFHRPMEDTMPLGINEDAVKSCLRTTAQPKQ